MLKLNSELSRINILKATFDIDFIVKFLAILRSEQTIAVFSSDWSEKEIQTRTDILSRHISAIHPETKLILFTSGSSGDPKAVQLSQKNILANTNAVIEALDFKSVKTQTLFLPLSYSFGLLGQLLPALTLGVTTRLLTRFADIKTIFESGDAEGMWSGVPSHWEAILKITAALPPDSFSKVTHVVSAGAALSKDLRKKLSERFFNAVIYNNYGQTELSPRSLCISSKDASFFEGATGYPVGDFQIKVTDDQELCFKGSQVMLGYLGDSHLTEKKIVDHWLYTGDLAQVSGQRLVTVLGRKDDLFKVGGERISPNEVESALKSVSFISDAAIFPEDDAMYGKKIIAFIVGKDAAIPLVKSKILDALKKLLTEHKLPKEFYSVDTLPRLSSGKLARAELQKYKLRERLIR